MVDIESMIKSLRLSWLKRIFGENSGAWKNYLNYLLKETGGLALFSCNYNTKDLNINSQFYLELLEWWSQYGGLSLNIYCIYCNILYIFTTLDRYR